MMRDPTGSAVKTKVVVRSLPPSLEESDFHQVIDELFKESYVYFRFKRGRVGQRNKKSIPSIAYVSFREPEAVFMCHEVLSQRPFTGSDGKSVIPVVEYAPFQKIQKKRNPHKKKDRYEGTIEEDKDFLKFCAALEKSREAEEKDPSTAPEVPPVDESVQENKVIITPLMEFIRKQRESKHKSKSKNKGKQAMSDGKQKESGQSGQRNSLSSPSGRPRSSSGKDSKESGSKGSSKRASQSQPSTSQAKEANGQHAREGGGRKDAPKSARRSRKSKEKSEGGHQHSQGNSGSTTNASNDSHSDKHEQKVLLLPKTSKAADGPSQPASAGSARRSQNENQNQGSGSRGRRRPSGGEDDRGNKNHTSQPATSNAAQGGRGQASNRGSSARGRPKSRNRSGRNNGNSNPSDSHKSSSNGGESSNRADQNSKKHSRPSANGTHTQWVLKPNGADAT